MGSVLEHPELNKIFLIYGNLDDMFLSPDLQRNNFRPFLNAYLRSLGYELIVFYSGAKNMGKYVLDDHSAMLAINSNKRRAAASSSAAAASDNGIQRRRRLLHPRDQLTQSAEDGSAAAAASAAATPADAANPGTAQADTGRRRRILSPRQQREQAAASTGTTAAVSASTDATPSDRSNALRCDTPHTTAPPAASGKLIYKQPKITPAEFLDDAKKMMSDASVKTAVVFPFFQDFVTDSAAPLQQYAELLSHLWDEYSLSSNENICIFLAPQMNAEALLRLFDLLPSGNIFRSRFFNADGTVNPRCTLSVGLPGKDEFRCMLDYLRIVGEGDKRLSYQMSDVPKLLSSLMYLSRQADREENRAGYLRSVYQTIARYMKQQPGDSVPFDEITVQRLYSRFQAADTTDPIEKLTHTRGWESVAQRVQEIVADFGRKKAAAAYQQGIPAVPAAPLHCASERIAAPDDETAFDYPIPHFVLRGNPGVGKTTVARLIGQIFYECGLLKRGITIEATREDLVDRYVGGTAARTRERIIEAQEGVLFIDDAYSLLDKSDENNYPKEAIDELVAAMTNTKQYRFCLIMAGYPDPMDELLTMNAGLRSRFSPANILTIEDYSPDILQSIFAAQCTRDGYRFFGSADGEQPPLDLDLFFHNLYQQRDRANFGNAREAVAIAKEVKMQASLRDDAARCITAEDFGIYGKYFDRRGVSSIDEIYAQLDNYVGLDFVRELFDTVRLEILDAEDCRRRGIRPDASPDHYIFAGNPGTGKTTVGKLIGQFYHQMGVMGCAETMFVDASELIGSHVGDSKEKTARCIQDAIDHNAILYIDEAYQIADTPYAAEIIGAMMTKMTENAADFKMIFGMYTNRVEDFLKLNAGLARRVRIVEFPDYNPDQLVGIFDKMLEAQGRTITDDAHRLIALLMEYQYNTRTDSFGNAGEVKRLVSDMKKRLLRRVSASDAGDIDRYQYTAEDIPPEELDRIKDQIHPRTLDDIMHDLNEQIGLSDLKQIILQKQEELLYAQKTGGSSYGITPGYYFFVGNPGTGKSTGAKLFGECLRELGIVKTDHFYACTAKDLIGQYVGETDKKTYELLKKSINGVLFIDEAYSLSYADEHGAHAGFKKEALEQIIAFMDVPEHRRSCCLIFAGYEKDMQGLYRSNSGMRSRIEEVYFRDYSAAEMYQIFALFCRKAGYAIADGVEQYYTPIFDKMTRQTYYSNGRTARTVFEKTAARLKHRVVHADHLTEEESRTILPADLLDEAECLRIVADKET